MALVPIPGQAAPTPSADEEVEPYAPEPAGDVSPEEPDEDLPDGRMTFLEHLDELRRRITHAIIGLLVGFVLAFALVNQISTFVFARLTADIPDGKLIFTQPTEAFFLWMKIAALAGVLISSPYLMWQVWLFIAPGLYSKEKKLAIPFVVGSSALFIGGAAFSHYIVFPFAWKFFASFSNDFLEFMPRVQDVFSLYVKLLLALGLVFQLPMLVFVLAKLGIVTAGFLVRNIKYAVLILFIVAAVITPDASPVTQSLVAAPMFALYLFSIGVAWLVGRVKGKGVDEDDER
jgi:sec-independent protein translocase protein TatC